MHDRDKKPVAATAVVVAFVLGVSALAQLIASAYESGLGHRHPVASAPSWVMAGK